MSDNRKYYYLKLKENYFDDDSIVLLESMQDGVLYSNILLKLYLKSLKHGGRLQLDEDIPYTAQMIATITRQQIGTVERALQIFLKLGLVEVLDSGTFYMSNIELLIGQSSTEAERKRAARLQNKALSALRTSGGHLSDIRPPEIEIELEKEIEIKREIEKVRPETGHPSHTYGRYQNVFLTDPSSLFRVSGTQRTHSTTNARTAPLTLTPKSIRNFQRECALTRNRSVPQECAACIHRMQNARGLGTAQQAF